MAKKTNKFNLKGNIDTMFGKSKEEWELAIQLLNDNINLYTKCGKQIENDGIMITDRFGVLVKHPLLKVQNDAQIQIIKLMNEFGMTPKAAKKLVGDVEENNELEEFLLNG